MLFAAAGRIGRRSLTSCPKKVTILTFLYRNTAPMLLPIASATNTVLGSLGAACSHLQPAIAVFVQYSEKKNNLYTILWALVFGFATLNILGLVTRRFEPSRLSQRCLQISKKLARL